MPRPQRPDGRARSVHDKAYARLLFESGIDPDDPGVRAKLRSKMKGVLPLSDEQLESYLDELIDDATWAKAGFPTR